MKFKKLLGIFFFLALITTTVFGFTAENSRQGFDRNFTELHQGVGLSKAAPAPGFLVCFLDSSRQVFLSGQSGNTKIDWGKQGKHIPGDNNFQPGKSTITNPKLQQLVDRFAGKGQQVGNTPRGQPGFKERIDFGEIIGEFVDNVTGQVIKTTKGIITYAKNGVHVIPARP